PDPHPFPTRRSSDLGAATVSSESPLAPTSIPGSVAASNAAASLAAAGQRVGTRAGNAARAAKTAASRPLAYVPGSVRQARVEQVDRKSTRLNSSHQI